VSSGGFETKHEYAWSRPASGWIRHGPFSSGWGKEIVRLEEPMNNKGIKLIISRLYINNRPLVLHIETTYHGHAACALQNASGGWSLTCEKKHEWRETNGAGVFMENPFR